MNKPHRTAAAPTLPEDVRHAGMMAWLADRASVLAGDGAPVDEALRAVVTTFIDESGGDGTDLALVEAMETRVFAAFI